MPFARSDVGQVDFTGLFPETDGGAAQLHMFEKVGETSVTSWVESWARHNGCSPDAPEVVSVGAGVGRTAYTDCDNGGDVVLQAVDGGGHDWPASPKLDATASALAFFRAHRLSDEALDG